MRMYIHVLSCARGAKKDMNSSDRPLSLRPPAHHAPHQSPGLSFPEISGLSIDPNYRGSCCQDANKKEPQFVATAKSGWQNGSSLQTIVALDSWM